MGSIARSIAIVRNIKASPEGGTIDLLGYQLPTTGYFVGGAAEPVILGQGDWRGLYGSVTRLIARAPSRFIGWWTDGEDGKLYVDGTDWFGGRGMARFASGDRGEIAFWDISSGCEIRV